MATDPVTGLPSYGGAATTGGSATTGGTTATPAATTPTPSGPQDLGINAAPPTTQTPTGPATIPNTPPVGENFKGLDPSIADKIVPGGFSVQGAKPTAPHSFDEAELVRELANGLGLKHGAHPVGLETRVVNALAKKYGIRVPMTTEGTGHKQGEAGQVRHALADWMDSNLSGQNLGASLHGVAHAGDTLSGKNKQRQEGFGQGMQQASGGDSTPDMSSKALNEMLDKVSARLGIKGDADGRQGFAQVAQAVGAPTGTPGTPGAGGRPQTASDVYAAFKATSFDANNALTTNGKKIATDLMNSGVLTVTQLNDPNAIAAGYATAINEAVKNNASINDTLTAGVYAGKQNVPAPADEWASYVQGVANEFGVALDPQQVNDIATQYYTQAVRGGVTSVANGPSSETDAIKNSVVSLYDPTKANDPAGVANQMFAGIKEQALAYGIPLSDQQIGQYVYKGLQGATVASMYTAKQSVIDQYKEVFQHQAQGLYPSLAPQIGAGMDVQTLIQPYNHITAQYTGKDEASLAAPGTDPTSPNYAFLQGGKDPKTGGPTMMTMDAWKQKLMQDPQYGFQNTQGAKNMASGFASAILNEFGLVNTGQVGSSFPNSSTITSANG